MRGSLSGVRSRVDRLALKLVPAQAAGCASCRGQEDTPRVREAAPGPYAGATETPHRKTSGKIRPRWKGCRPVVLPSVPPISTTPSSVPVTQTVRRDSDPSTKPLVQDQAISVTQWMKKFALMLKRSRRRRGCQGRPRSSCSHTATHRWRNHPPTIWTRD